MKSSVFTQDEYELAYPVGIENHFWSKSRISILEKNLVHFGLNKKKILEIGCGKGIAVSALRKKGFDCTGVELANIEPLDDVKNFVACNMAAQQMDLTFRHSIEVILLLDVIEHVKDVKSFFAEIKKSFIHARWVVITVPARKEFWSNYDDFYGHFRRYDLSMTADLGTTIGYQRAKHRYFFGSLYWVGLISLKIFGKRDIEGHAPSGIMIIFHRIAAALLYSEYCITPGRFRGSSIIAVYQTQ